MNKQATESGDEQLMADAGDMQKIVMTYDSDRSANGFVNTVEMDIETDDTNNNNNANNNKMGKRKKSIGKI